MQQQTNFFTPTQKHLIQLHGFPNITDIIYVKPLYSVRSLVVYPSNGTIKIWRDSNIERAFVGFFRLNSFSCT